MNSNKPYLIRALHEWISDNNLTPHIVVDAHIDGVMVPSGAIQDGKVTLNISNSAVVGLELANDSVSFQARFQGASQSVWVPVAAVIAIYARENGQGMLFPEEAGDDDAPPDGSTPATTRPQLKVVK